MPDIKLPEVHLPEGLRDMRREDIQQAMSDVRLPHVDVADVARNLPKNLKMPTVDLSKVELPAAIEQRIPGRRRRNPVRPVLLAGLVLGAAAWLLLASPIAPRIRRGIDDLRFRMTGRGGMSDADLEPTMISSTVTSYDESSDVIRPAVAVGPGESGTGDGSASVDPVGAESAYATYAGEGGTGSATTSVTSEEERGTGF
jgi:hypothetical protein